MSSDQPADQPTNQPADQPTDQNNNFIISTTAYNVKKTFGIMYNNLNCVINYPE